MCVCVCVCMCVRVNKANVRARVCMNIRMEVENVILFCRESDVDEHVDWKMHKDVSYSRDKCSISISHFCPKALRTTSSGKDVLTGLFTALVYITSLDSCSRKIEVCCVDTAVVEVCSIYAQFTEPQRLTWVMFCIYFALKFTFSVTFRRHSLVSLLQTTTPQLDDDTVVVPR